MRNLFIGFLVVAALVVGGGVVANVAYQVGVTTAVNVAAANAPDGSVVTPVVPGAYPYGYGYGPGWGHGGPGIFGILVGLFFLFIFFGLIRAAFWRGGGGRGWGGGGPGGWGEHGGRSRFHDTFEDWHRRAHGESAGSATGATGSNPPRDTSA